MLNSNSNSSKKQRKQQFGDVNNQIHSNPIGELYPQSKPALTFSAQQVTEMLKKESLEKEKLLNANYLLKKKQVIEKFQTDLATP